MDDEVDFFDSQGRKARQRREWEMIRMAEGNEDIITIAQLQELGFSYKEIELRVTQGRLRRRHNGVYELAGRPPLDRGLLIAALAAAGPNAFLSHRTAAAVRGLQRLYRGQIEVTIPLANRRSRRGLKIHRATTMPHPDDVEVVRGLRVSAVPRMLVELAKDESESTLVNMVSLCVQRRLLRLEDLDELARLEAALARHTRRPGITKVTRALRGYRRTEDCKSTLEKGFDIELLLPHPEIPEPERNIYLAGWEIDRYWRDFGLCVELDGRPYHIAVREMERDRRKDTMLQRIDKTPIRVTDLRFQYAQDEILDDLYHFLRIVR